MVAFLEQPNTNMNIVTCNITSTIGDVNVQLVNLGCMSMIDLDIYYPNEKVEMFMRQLEVRLNKPHPVTKIYISTANPYGHWIKKIKEEQENEIYVSKT